MPTLDDLLTCYREISISSLRHSHKAQLDTLVSAARVEWAEFCKSSNLSSDYVSGLHLVRLRSLAANQKTPKEQIQDLEQPSKPLSDSASSTSLSATVESTGKPEQSKRKPRSTGSSKA